MPFAAGQQTFGIDAKCLLLWPTNGMPAGIWHRCQTVQVPTVTRFMTFGIDVKRLLLWPTKVLLYRVPSPTSTKGYNSTTPHDVSRGTFPLRPNTTAPCTAPSDPTTQLVLRRVKLEELETVRKAFRNVQITQNMLISWSSTQNS